MPLNIEWTNPPDPRPSHQVTTELDEAATVLADNPGQWARLWTDLPVSTAKSRVKALRDRDPRIKARVTTSGCGTADFYAIVPTPAAIRATA
mgnify:CR=1 FL=1